MLFTVKSSPGELRGFQSVVKVPLTLGIEEQKHLNNKHVEVQQSLDQ